MVENEFLVSLLMILDKFWHFCASKDIFAFKTSLNQHLGQYKDCDGPAKKRETKRNLKIAKDK